MSCRTYTNTSLSYLRYKGYYHTRRRWNACSLRQASVHISLPITNESLSLVCFFGEYMYKYALTKTMSFGPAQRLINNMMVSNADAIISQFESAFGDLKIELILGSTLQTTIFSFRILQGVENIGKTRFTHKEKSNDS